MTFRYTLYLSSNMTMPKSVSQQLFLSDLKEGIACATYLICTSGNHQRTLMNRCRVVDCKNTVTKSIDCNSLRKIHYIRIFNLHLMKKFYNKQLKLKCRLEIIRVLLIELRYIYAHLLTYQLFEYFTIDILEQFLTKYSTKSKVFKLFN